MSSRLSSDDENYEDMSQKEVQQNEKTQPLQSNDKISSTNKNDFSDNS
jgi:hypothetical protein